jgi:hypothetical protein
MGIMVRRVMPPVLQVHRHWRPATDKSRFANFLRLTNRPMVNALALRRDSACDDSRHI